MSLLSTEDKLNERIKELTCLYDLLTVIQKDLPLEKALPAFANVVRPAWLYEQNAVVEIKLDSYHIFTKPLLIPTVFQESLLQTFGKISGHIRVHYPSDSYGNDAFIPEELLLLNKVAAEISLYYEKKITQERNVFFNKNAAHLDRLSILGEITAGIAHELNTPLGNILGFAELIQKQNIDTQTAYDISKIINSAIYSREIVKKLMFFSCDMPQNADIIKVEQVFTQVLALLGPNFKKATVNYTLTFDNPDIKVRVDSVQLTQVLFNILINSIYVSPANSLITINVSHDAQNLYFEIADQGPGIPDDIKPKIFEPFFTTKPVGEGTGLGLSVVHGIVKSHSGDISAKDNHPKGVIFSVRLPLNLKTWD